jgi:membrane-associated phospholipid phosphatase
MNLGLTANGSIPSWPGPFGSMPPPPPAIEAREVQYIHRLTDARTPEVEAWVEAMSRDGGTKLWWNLAKQYRQVAGPVRGWIGTGVLAAAMGVTALKSQLIKRHFDRLRPFQVDPTIAPAGKLPKDASYPSGHSSSAFAAATVLSRLWPSRSMEFVTLARQVATSRMYAGVHFPSDVTVGARLGIDTAMRTMNALGVV